VAAQSFDNGTVAPSIALPGEKRRDIAAPKRGSVASGASPSEATVTRSTRAPALSVSAGSFHSSSKNSAFERVSVFGTKASSPSAEKSSHSNCTPNTPRSVPPASGSAACVPCSRNSLPRLANVVPTSPEPSISWCS
jgi:hypothetical protein